MFPLRCHMEKFVGNHIPLPIPVDAKAVVLMTSSSLLSRISKAPFLVIKTRARLSNLKKLEIWTASHVTSQSSLAIGDGG